MRVKLGIYDISGREILIIANRNYNEGDYKFSWDGKDKNGQIVPSGTYFCRLEAGGFAAVKKLILTR